MTGVGGGELAGGAGEAGRLACVGGVEEPAGCAEGTTLVAGVGCGELAGGVGEARWLAWVGGVGEPASRAEDTTLVAGDRGCGELADGADEAGLLACVGGVERIVPVVVVGQSAGGVDGTAPRARLRGVGELAGCGGEVLA